MGVVIRSPAFLSAIPLSPQHFPGTTTCSTLIPPPTSCPTRRSTTVTPRSTLSPDPPPNASKIRTPARRRNPLWGLLRDVARGHWYNLEQRERYGPIFKSDVQGLNITNIADLNDIKACLRNPIFSAEDSQSRLITDMLSKDSLIFIEGEPLRTGRARYTPGLQPALHSRFLAIVLESASAVWDNPSGVNGDLEVPLAQHALRVIARFSTSAAPLPDGERSVVEVCARYTELFAGMLAIPRTPKRRRALRARDWLVDWFAELARTRASQDAEVLSVLQGADPTQLAAVVREGRVDMLTALTAAHGATSKLDVDDVIWQQVANSVLDIWLAGTFTQTAALVIVVKEIGSNPEIWRRIRTEQDGVAEVTVQAVMEDMPLLESLVLECLRLHPPLSGIMRRVTEGVEVGGHWIEKGEVVKLDVLASLQDETYFEGAREFRMDRFVGQEELVKMVQVVFGGIGSRHSCLGAQLAKINTMATVAVLVRNFELELEPRTTHEYATIPKVRPRDGLKMRNIRRR